MPKHRTIKPVVREYIKLSRRLQVKGAELMGINGLSPKASAVLCHVIDHPGCTIEDISSESGIRVNEVFQICDRLAKRMPEREEFIERKSEKPGSGPYFLYPTGAGKKFFHRQFAVI